MSNNSEIKEVIKGFLIVGESLEGIHSFEEYQPVNIIIGIILFLSSLFSLFEGISNSFFWYFVFFAFALVSFYFLITYKVFITYAITKFRIIKLESDFISRWLFSSSRLIGFTDLHYEHIESINIGTPRLQWTRFYVSLFFVIFGWIIFDTLSGANLFYLFAGILMVVIGTINILFSIPLGGVKLIIQSISGEIMELPEKKTPVEFIDNLILFCRTFLSYGAI